MIDTHAHLYVEAFDEDRDIVIKDAIEKGVSHFYIPAIDSAYHERMFELEKSYPENVHLMMGLHPTHVKENFLDELSLVETQLEQRKFSAIGEIGMDLYWDKSFKKQQQEAFGIQIEWAKIHGLPIVIHCRDAFDEVFEVLDQYKDESLYGIFHCFTGTLAQANRAIELNFKLGIGGVVTFKNGKIDQFLNQIPLHSIVLETDAPYLAPTPNRGKRNESGFLSLIRDKVASVYGLPPQQISLITNQNALDVFKK